MFENFSDHIDSDCLHILHNCIITKLHITKLHITKLHITKLHITKLHITKSHTFVYQVTSTQRTQKRLG